MYYLDFTERIGGTERLSNFPKGTQQSQVNLALMLLVFKPLICICKKDS